jgi:DNA repair exonuclease SbcCD ATPase subunit
MYNKIIHIADVHIRNYIRHNEYKAVFKDLFKQISDLADDKTLIYLGGDIVHSKTDMTPELIDLTSYFIRSCADIATTVLILGNHDVNLKNTHRLDALSPIVKTLNHPRLHYLKDTQLYELDNIVFSIYSVLGDPKKWIPATKIQSDKIKICLHHGAVLGSKTDMGYAVNNEYVNTDLFAGFDLTLLGDIHINQYLDKQKRIHYCGSLIQQDHGETLAKGFTVWNLNDFTSEFIHVRNDIGYTTLHCKDDKIITDREYLNQWPSNIRLRLKHDNCSKEFLRDVIDKLKTKYSIIEVSTPKINSNIENNTRLSLLDDVRDVEYQNRLISEYMRDNKITNIDTDYIRHINRIINSELNSNTKLLRNVSWNPKKLEFSNMFSYGANNKINFEPLTGIQGIFSKNATGKSSLLDIFTYCIYDKCSRAWKGKDILNNRSNKFYCRLLLELNGEDYVIERTGFRKKDNNSVKVEVYFYKISIDGSKILLNGKDRDQTNKEIRDLFGTYDDFLLTTLSAQIDNKNFILKSQKERKELLYSFLDLSVFDQLNEIAKKLLKPKANKLELLTTQLAEISNAVNVNSRNNLAAEIDNINKTLLELDSQRNTYQTEINTLNIQITPLANLDTANINKYNTDKNELNDKLIKIDLLFKDIESKNIELEISKINSLISDPKFNNIKFVTSELYNKSTHLQSLILEEKSLKSNIEKIKILILKLEGHQYDPLCKYCIQNPFVQEAKQSTMELPGKEMKLKQLQGEIELLSQKIKSMQMTIDDYKSIEKDLNSKKEEFNSDKELYNEAYKHKLDYMHKISNIDHQIKLINENQTIIETNQNLQKSVNKLEHQILEITKKYNEYTTKLADKLSSLTIMNRDILKYSELAKEYEDLNREVLAYSLYTKMTHYDGLPYIILKKILPIIESETNLILADTVNFYVKFESDQKFNINCYLNYNDEQSWPVEMASGMERFIVSLAIRCALVEITSLPKPSFLAIDEGFGALDEDKIINIDHIFNYMRGKFDFVIAVSHVNSMRDMVDGLINININEDGFSEVVSI